jgi:predicted RecA/RadA family phage recombinase
MHTLIKLATGVMAALAAAMIALGATNEINKPGWGITLVITHPAAPNSGDPVRFGELTGVAMLDEGDGGAGSTETVTYLGPGIYDLSVDDNEGTGIAVGDSIYYHDTQTGTPATSLNNTATSMDAFFGIALEIVGTNATTTINVLHIPVGSNIAIANGATDTAALAAGAVTSAKVEASLVRYTDTQLSAGELNAVRGANIEVVATPGANLAIFPIAVHIFLDHGGTDFVQVNNSDQLALLYNGSNEIMEIGSEAQCTALLEAGADAALFDPCDLAGFIPEANKAIDLDNNGAAEYTTGDGTLSIRVYYVTVPMVAFS